MKYLAEKIFQALLFGRKKEAIVFVQYGRYNRTYIIIYKNYQEAPPFIYGATTIGKNTHLIMQVTD